MRMTEEAYEACGITFDEANGIILLNIATIYSIKLRRETV